MKSVLLIEDDLTYAQVLSMLLAEEGYSVTHAATAAEGVALYRKLKPDLLITDILLADADGLEMLLGLKREFPECRVIGISGGIDGDTTWLAPLSSVLPNFRFLQKPFAFKALRDSVAQLLAASDEGGKTTVLLVDDDTAVREVLAHLLESAGLAVKTASGGEEALDQLRSGRVDVIVTDLMMPGISGLDLIKRIRALAPTLPMVAVTGELLRGVTMLEDAIQNGVTATLVKPFSSAELVRVVQRCAGEEKTREHS